MNIDVDFKALTLCGGNAFLLMIPQRGFKLPNWETGCSTDAVWDWISGGSKGICIYILIVVIFLCLCLYSYLELPSIVPSAFIQYLYFSAFIIWLCLYLELSNWEIGCLTGVVWDSGRTADSE